MLMFLTCRTVQKGGLLDFAIMTSCDQLVARLLKNIPKSNTEIDTSTVLVLCTQIMLLYRALHGISMSFSLLFYTLFWWIGFCSIISID